MKTLAIIAVLGTFACTSIRADEVDSLKNQARAVQPMPEVSALFQRHFAQIGGTQELARVECVVVEGVTESAGVQRPFTLSIRSPGLVLLEKSDEQGRPMKLGRGHDHRLWMEVSKTHREAGDYDKGELAALVIAFHPPQQLFLSERLADAVCDRVTCKGEPAFATGKRGARRHFSRMVFVESTGLIGRIGSTTLEDYKTVGALRFPHVLRTIRGEVFKVNRVSFPAELPLAKFSSGAPREGWLADLMPSPSGSAESTSFLLSAPGTLQIVRHPSPANSREHSLSKLPEYDPISGRHAQVSLQGADLRKLDISARGADLMHADFDTRTQWPKRLPPEFEPSRVLELGKDPGLGTRQLHARGITGKGVGIATIDFPLLTTHAEYADRLRLYEEIGSGSGMLAHMHGTAVASIAAGKTCGVAPGADLYHIASRNFQINKERSMEMDWSLIARSIHRLLDISTNLPSERRIRVISLSMGWSPGETGFDEMMNVVKRAKEERVFVISTALRKTHQLSFDGLSRTATACPDDPRNFGPGSWWADLFWSGEMRFKPGKRLCVPMDARTTASPVGSSDYVHYDAAGWSWSVPWIAGLYALACEVRPDITPEQFWAAALRTGRTTQLQHEGEIIPFGTIADPVALITLIEASPAL